MTCYIATGNDQAEIDEAATQMRRQVAFYGSTPAYRPVLEIEGWGDLQPELNALSKRGDVAGMQSLVTDEMVETLAVRGTPEQCADDLERRFGDVADGALTGLVLATLFVPPISLLIPNYVIVSKLGWLDSLSAVIVPGAAGAFGVFFLRQFFSSLPMELEEAAEIDGANRWQTFFRIVLPLSKPGISTLLVLSFLTNYNDFLWPVFVLFSPGTLTLPAGLSILQGAFTINYPVVMAGAAIASVPAIVLFILAQRNIVEGVARSGLKG